MLADLHCDVAVVEVGQCCCHAGIMACQHYLCHGALLLPSIACQPLVQVALWSLLCKLLLPTCTCMFACHVACMHDSASRDVQHAQFILSIPTIVEQLLLRGAPLARTASAHAPLGWAEPSGSGDSFRARFYGVAAPPAAFMVRFRRPYRPHMRPYAGTTRMFGRGRPVALSASHGRKELARFGPKLKFCRVHLPG